jgi:hypothetical protein
MPKESDLPPLRCPILPLFRGCSPPSGTERVRPPKDTSLLAKVLRRALEPRCGLVISLQLPVDAPEISELRHAFRHRWQNRLRARVEAAPTWHEVAFVSWRERQLVIKRLSSAASGRCTGGGRADAVSPRAAGPGMHVPRQGRLGGNCVCTSPRTTVTLRLDTVNVPSRVGFLESELESKELGHLEHAVRADCWVTPMMHDVPHE